MPEKATRLRGGLFATFETSGGRTVARIDGGSAPLELRGPFERDDVATFYLRNISCGVFAGDRYDVRLHAAAGAQAVVRGTSATKVHAMPVGHARSRTILDAAPGATLAFVDGPLILQGGADLRQSVEITARPGAIVAYAEIIVLGRLARGELVRFRRFDSEIIVRGVDGEPLYTERFSLVPECHGDTIIDASAPVVATLIVAGAPAEPEQYWSALPFDGDGYIAGCDALPDGAGIVLRAAGSKLEPVAALIDAAVAAIAAIAPPLTLADARSRTGSARCAGSGSPLSLR